MGFFSEIPLGWRTTRNSSLSILHPKSQKVSVKSTINILQTLEAWGKKAVSGWCRGIINSQNFFRCSFAVLCIVNLDDNILEYECSVVLISATWVPNSHQHQIKRKSERWRECVEAVKKFCLWVLAAWVEKEKKIIILRCKIEKSRISYNSNIRKHYYIYYNHRFQ